MNINKDLKKNRKHITVFALCFIISLNLFQHREYMSLDVQGMHTWRQSLTMWNIRNFTRHDANILNPRVSKLNKGHNLNRLEFPIMQWSIGMVQRILGENMLIVRFILFLIGTFSCIGMFCLFLLLTKNWFASIITTTLFQYSPLFYFYSINPMPDNLAMCGAIFYLLFFIKFTKTKRFRHLVLASLFLLIATLAKLPFLMFSIVSIYFFFSSLIKKNRNFNNQITYGLIQLIIIAPAIIWYAWVFPKWGPSPVLKGVFATGFLTKENWEIFDFNWSITFWRRMMTPAIWILFIIGFIKIVLTRKKPYWLFWYIGMTMLYFALEMPAIGYLHDYYLMPFLPWMFIVIAYGVHTMSTYHKHLKPPILLVCLYGILFNPPIVEHLWSQKESYINSDLFKYKAELRNAVPNDALCIIQNDHSGVSFSYQIDKMGFGFYSDQLKLEWMPDILNNNNIEYMYSDSEKINDDPRLQNYIEEVVLEAGSIKVFKLKIPAK